MKNSTKTKMQKRAADRLRELIAACHVELRAIAEEQIGDYEAALATGVVNWGHVGDVGAILRKLREVQGIED